MDVHTIILCLLFVTTIKKRWIFTLFFRVVFRKIIIIFYFLKEFDSQIDENDRHEQEILFDVFIVPFLSVDISIVAFE